MILHINKQLNHCGIALALLVLHTVFTSNSQAAQANLSLLDSFTNDLEASSARANLRTFNNLVGTDSNRGICFLEDRDNASAPLAGSACSGNVFKVFKNTRELAQNVTQLSPGQDGGTQFSLGLDEESLGFALRWTAGEEFSAQGSQTNEFINGQLSGLASRLSALRQGARGFQLANTSGFDPVLAYGYNRRYNIGQYPMDQYYPALYNPSPYNTARSANDDYLLPEDFLHHPELRQSLANTPSYMVYNANAENPQGGFSRLGGFFNSSYGWGNKAPTDREDAFDFNATNYTLGVDYRIDNHWIAGATLGIIEQVIDFDASKSIVDGGIDSNGYSLMPFVMYQQDNFFSSLALGYMNMKFKTRRFIKYPSLNPAVTSTNTEARSDNSASVLSLFLETGYNYTRQSLSIEPYFGIDYQSINIGGFTEKDINNDGFNLEVEEQKFNSLELSPGLKASYTLNTDDGVFIPYVDATYRKQLETAARTITARYAALPSEAATDFSLKTDSLDSDYFTFSVGSSAVFKGAAINKKGYASGGISGFLFYKRLVALKDYEEQILSFGARYEF